METISTNTLDLRWKAPLTGQLAQDYERLAGQLRREFCDFVDRLSIHHGNNIDWWMSTPSTRNQSVSYLFHFCVALVLLDEQRQAAGDPPGEVLVDTPAQKRVIEEDLRTAKNTVSVTLRPSWPCGPLKRLRRALSPYRALAGSMLDWLVIRITRRWQKTPSPAAALTLLDLYKIPAHGETDPYYAGLWEHIPSSQRHRIWYVPQFVGFGIRQLWRTVLGLRRSEKNFLLKEDYLGPSDWLYIAGHFRRSRALTIPAASFRRWNLSDVVDEELRQRMDPSNAVAGLMNFRFPTRLKRRGLRLRRSIDWYENQIADRGWNAGFRAAFPDIDLVGYQSTHAAYLSIKPTAVEYRAGVLPKSLAVMGSGYAKDRREFFDAMPLEIAPAFRYQWLWRTSRSAAPAHKVLVALPIDERGTTHIMRSIMEVGRSLPHLHFWIKVHPAARISSENPAFSDASCSFVDGPLEEWLPRSTIAVCGGLTTAGLEAMACGLPTVLMVVPGTGAESPIPNGIPEGAWYRCHDAQSLISTITEIDAKQTAKLGHWQEMGERIKRDYFCPVTSERVAQFLALDPTSTTATCAESDLSAMTT